MKTYFGNLTLAFLVLLPSVACRSPQPAVVRESPPLPITINTRGMFTAPGLAYDLNNSSTNLLALTVTLSNPARETKVFKVTVLPQGLREIGFEWSGGTNDTILVEAEGYQPLRRSF